MGADEQQNELTDVSLCYLSMGISLGASPAEIEQRYKAITDEYKKKLVSQDPVQRDEARVSLELVAEMYQKIRHSITYRAMERDHQKREPEIQVTSKRVHDVVAQRGLMMHCPRCNGSIIKGTKLCPICKGAVQTPMERFTENWLSPKMLIIYFVVLAVITVVATRLLQPEASDPKTVFEQEQK